MGGDLINKVTDYDLKGKRLILEMTACIVNQILYERNTIYTVYFAQSLFCYWWSFGQLEQIIIE